MIEHLGPRSARFPRRQAARLSAAWAGLSGSASMATAAVSTMRASSLTLFPFLAWCLAIGLYGALSPILAPTRRLTASTRPDLDPRSSTAARRCSVWITDDLARWLAWHPVDPVQSDHAAAGGQPSTEPVQASPSSCRVVGEKVDVADVPPLGGWDPDGQNGLGLRERPVMLVDVGGGRMVRFVLGFYRGTR